MKNGRDGIFQEHTRGCSNGTTIAFDQNGHLSQRVRGPFTREDPLVGMHDGTCRARVCWGSLKSLRSKSLVGGIRRMVK